MHAFGIFQNVVIIISFCTSKAFANAVNACVPEYTAHVFNASRDLTIHLNTMNESDHLSCYCIIHPTGFRDTITIQQQIEFPEEDQSFTMVCPKWFECRYINYTTCTQDSGCNLTSYYGSNMEVSKKFNTSTWATLTSLSIEVEWKSHNTPFLGDLGIIKITFGNASNVQLQCGDGPFTTAVQSTPSTSSFLSTDRPKVKPKSKGTTKHKTNPYLVIGVGTGFSIIFVIAVCLMTLFLLRRKSRVQSPPVSSTAVGQVARQPLADEEVCHVYKLNDLVESQPDSMTTDHSTYDLVPASDAKDLKETYAKVNKDKKTTPTAVAVPLQGKNTGKYCGDDEYFQCPDIPPKSGEKNDTEE